MTRGGGFCKSPLVRCFGVNLHEGWKVRYVAGIVGEGVLEPASLIEAEETLWASAPIAGRGQPADDGKVNVAPGDAAGPCSEDTELERVRLRLRGVMS